MTTESRPTDSKPVEALTARPARQDASQAEANPYEEDLDECDLPPLKPLPGDFYDGVLYGILGTQTLILLVVFARHIAIRIAQ